MGDSKQTEFESAYEAGRRAVPVAAQFVTGADGIPFAVLPEGMAIKSLQEFADKPRRKKARVVLADLPSFLRYVNAQKTPGTIIYADRENSRLAAVLDGNADTEPGHQEHHAQHALKMDRAWKAWLALNDRPLTPTALAEHLEVWGENVADPPAGALAGLIGNLELEETVTYGHREVLQNGSVKISFERETQGKGGGQMLIPATITLGLKRYENETFPDGAEAYPLVARLRYKLTGQKLAFTLLFNHPEKVEEVAFGRVLAQVTDATGLEPFLGKPE